MSMVTVTLIGKMGLSPLNTTHINFDGHLDGYFDVTGEQGFTRKAEERRLKHNNVFPAFHTSKEI